MIIVYGAGDARDHATFQRLGSERPDVRYALHGGTNGLLARGGGVVAVDGPEAVLELAGSDGNAIVVVQRPELLLDGVVDTFAQAGLRVLGPGRSAAELEGSKLRCKRLLRDHDIPTPAWHEVDGVDEAERFLRTRWGADDRRWVVKSDRYISDARLRATVPETLNEAIEAVRRLGELPPAVRGQRILLEQRVAGTEVSVHAFVDGSNTHVCPLVADYKRLGDGDRGPNTHGMGAIASTRPHSSRWLATIAPLVSRIGAALAGEGMAYCGVLYVGVVVTSDGPSVLECNVRPGNPEWQTLLALLQTPLVTVFERMTNGGLTEAPSWSSSRMAGAVFAAVDGYPAYPAPVSDAEIHGLSELPDDVQLLGEGMRDSGGLRAGSGRSLCLVTTAEDPGSLRERLYLALGKVRFDGMQTRRDVGLHRPLVTEDGVAPPPERHAELLREAALDQDRVSACERVAGATAQLIAATGRGLQLAEAALQNLDLSGFDLRRATFNRAQLYGADLSRADLTEAAMICPGIERTKFTEAVLRGAYLHALGAQVCDFRRADLRDLVDSTGALFHGCYLDGADLRGAMLSGSSFYQTALIGARLDGANLQGCQFAESSCAGASFASAQLDDAVFTRVDLSGTGLRGAIGANVVIQAPTGASALDLGEAGLTGLRLVGVRARDVQAVGLRAPSADLRDCHLPGIDLRGADLSASSWTRVTAPAAQLGRAILDAARWIECVFDEADLSAAKGENLSSVGTSAVNANLTGFKGRCAKFRNCDLSGSDMTSAYLYRAMLTGDPPTSMKLTGVRMGGAVIVQAYITADLTGADLRNVRGAYVRLNQTVLALADVSGAQLFEASLVKTDLRGATMNAVAAPLLADRCPGLADALSAADEVETLEQVTELGRALHRTKGLST